MQKYNLVAKVGSGTFSEVCKAQSCVSGQLVAIKRFKARFDSRAQVENLREIQALRRLGNHPNIIHMHEVIYEAQTKRLSIVFELMELNLYECIRQHRARPLPEATIQRIAAQILSALAFMHANGIFHRDIKPENVMITPSVSGAPPLVRLADLGSCRSHSSKHPFTEYISTRWYRSPECLLTDGYYNHKLDIWGVGCILYELITGHPLFPGKNEVDQIRQIHGVLGTPPPTLLDKMKRYSKNGHVSFNFPPQQGCGLASLIPNASTDLLDILSKLLAYNPDERISAKNALLHPYFAAAARELQPAPSPRITEPAPETERTRVRRRVEHRERVPPPPPPPPLQHSVPSLQQSQSMQQLPPVAAPRRRPEAELPPLGVSQSIQLPLPPGRRRPLRPQAQATGALPVLPFR